MVTVNDSTSRLEKAMEKVDVEVGQFSRREKKEAPGYLPVLISNYPFELDNVKFFGVEEKGASISGQGVLASEVKEEHRAKVVYFDMEELVKTGQYTENTAEGVIMMGGRELGRESLNSEPALYIG